MKLATELDHVGLIAKDSRTLRRVFRVLSGDNGAEGRLSKAVFPVSWFENPVHPSIEDARERLAQMLEESGTAVSRGALPDAVTSVEAQTLQALIAKGIFDNHRPFIEAHEGALPQDLLTLAKAGERVSAQDHAQLRQTQRHLGDVMDHLVDDNTFIVVPSVIDMPPILGSGTGLRDPQRLWTLLGWPAVSIPFGRYDGDHAHLSMGLQLVAKRGFDHPLLELAEEIERSRCKLS